MTTRTLNISLPDPWWAILDRLAAAADPSQTTESLIEELLDHVQQGVYRSGAWEREWLEHAVPYDQIERAYHPEDDPINRRIDRAKNIYTGERETTGTRVIVERDDGLCTALNPYRHIHDHSPTGFEWGCGGSGPTQLALALCCDALGVETGRQVYQEFTRERVCSLARDGWELTGRDVMDWVNDWKRRNRVTT